MAKGQMANQEGGTGPRVCVCGYDLAGLPVSPHAQCPECGALRSSLALGRSGERLSRFLLIVALAPACVMAVSALVVIAQIGPTVGTVAFLTAVLFAVLSWVVSIPAAFVWLRPRARQIPSDRAWTVSMVVVLIVVVLQTIAAGAVLTFAYLLFRALRYYA